MKSQAKRSIAKAITWRITASLDTFVIAWVITGKFDHSEDTMNDQ